ncbi:MAG: WecB/TagA/CpsF family glycosyltransferase [Thermoleophilia bacterium]
MRILLPTIRDPGQIGGTTTHLDMLARGLEEIGHDPRVLYLGGALPGSALDLGVVWPAGALNRVRRGWGMIYAAAARGRLLAAVTDRELKAAREAGRPWEVLNAQEVYSVPPLRAVADRHGIPLVLTLHGYPLFESLSEGYSTESSRGRDFLMSAELRALRLADAVVTVDSRLYRHVLRLTPDKAAVTSALQNFIDTSSFYPSLDGRDELRRTWDIPEGRTVLFCPRRLVKKNGVVYPSLALAAMNPPERDRFLLLHAGDGGEREAMESVIEKNGLGGHVRMLGGQGREAILELYRIADIILVPSVHSENVEEATSLSALEAMACGRPLIAGAVGGLAEMIDDGENGLLIPAGDPEALAAAILRLSADPDLGARLAETARDYVVENHSHLRAAASYVDIYRSAADAVGGSMAPPTSAPAAAPTTSAFSSISVLGLPFHRVGLDEAAELVLGWASCPLDGAPGGRTRTALSFNPELVVRAQDDEAVAEALLAADLRFPDGIGVVWAAARRGVRGVERVPGIEVAERVLEGAAREGLGVYFLGAAPGVAERAAEMSAARHPGLIVAGTHDGYFSDAEIPAVVEAVRSSGAAILLVAMGAPRQELFIYRHRDELGVPVALGVGGSFDVWSGLVRRAPAWTRVVGVEWLYRLLTDPRRLRRQLALPVFARRVLTDVASDYHRPRG